MLAGWLTHGLWPDPGGRTLALNPDDQTLYEWFLAVDARALLGDFRLVTDRLNAPDGVNLMANTSVIALGVAAARRSPCCSARPTTFALLAAGQPGRHGRSPGTCCSTGPCGPAGWPPRSAALCAASGRA